MAEEPRLATSEAVVLGNMEGFVPNSGVHNVTSSSLRPVLYPVTDAGNPNTGWYAHHAVPVSSGGIVENPNFVYQVGGGAPNFAYRVGHGIGENPNFVIGGGISQNPTFVNRVGGGIGGSPTFNGRGSADDQASNDSVDDLSPGKKVKLLCSFGGKILQRPTDGVLRYAGGQTRIISVTRDINFQELWHKMIDVYGKPVVIKYQLPDGELDSLVSVSSTEDLENMMDEYGKLVESSSDGSAKLRVFLFSASEIDFSVIGQFSDQLDSGQRYIDAVNGILDGVGIGITRKVSIESATSTQYSDGTIGGSEGADCSSHGQGEGGALSSPSMLSPTGSAVASHNPQTSMVYVAPNPVGYAPPMSMGHPLTGLPQTLSSSQPEPEFKRPAPAMVHPQVPLGYDLQKPFGMDLRPATAYMQAYVDPHQQLSSQVGHLNPHGVGIPGPIYRYAEAPPQLRDNVVGIAHQQFIPTVPMYVPSLDPHVGMNTNVVQQVMQPPQTQVDRLGENTFKGRVVQLPVEQSCPVYQPQSPPYSPTVPLQAGGGCGLIPPAQHVVLSDGWATHQPRILPEKAPNFEDCFMCQKELPHAHSDTVVQNHRNCISSTVSDANLVYHSAHLEDNLGARPVNRVVVSGALGEAEYQESRSQARVFSNIDRIASDLSRPGFSQDIEVQPDKDRILQKLDTPDNPGVLFSQAPFGNAVDVKSQYGVILHDIPQSHHEDALQQSSVPHLYQVKQEPLLNLPVGSDFPPVDTTPVQNLKPVVRDSSSKNSGFVVKEDTSPSTSDHLRPIDGRVEGSDASPREVCRGNEQCSSPVYKFKIEDVPVSRPQMLGQEMFLSNDLDKPIIISDRNHIMPSGILPYSSEVTHLDSSHPLESNQITKPVILGSPRPYSHLNIRTQPMTSEELLHGKLALSGVDSDYANFNTLSVGERKDDAVICPPSSSIGNTLSPYGGMFGDNWERSSSNSFFSNQGPWTLRHDTHFLHPETNEEAANEESFITREELFYTPSGDLNKGSNSEHTRSNEDMAEEDIKQEPKAVAEEVLHKPPEHLNKDPNSENNQSNKDVADEYIRQELKAVAEGVAAMVLESPTPSDSVVRGMNESSPEGSHCRVPDRGLEAQMTTKTKDVKTRLQDKENIGLLLSEGIGHLQIIKNSDLEELRELGSGTFGTVYHGKWRGSDVAIKRFNDRCFSGKPSEQSRMIDDFWNEAIKLADLHHPNVVAFYGVVLDGPGESVATVTEFMVNGSLRQALQRALDKRKRLLIAMDVAFGMEYLHGKNIVHFDLKSDNLLVNLRDPHRPICKVGDLGLSKMKCHTLISGGVRGTLPWMAPELLNGSSSLVSEKVDVFSFGIVMWELLTGEEPYADLHYGVIIGGIVSNTLRPPVPESCDLGWRSLMERCWSSDPSVRPSFKEISDQLQFMAASLPPKGQTQ